MVSLVEMLTKGLSKVRFGNVAKMFYHSFLELSFGLSHIQEVTVGTSDTIYQFAAMAGIVLAAFVFSPSSW